MKASYKFLALLLVVILAASACSRKKNTFLTRNYRAVNAEFNALHYGYLALEQGKQSLAETMIDDYFETLPIERIKVPTKVQLPGETRNTDFERSEEKATYAIQKHSLNIKDKEHNPQIDEAYLLLGQARYYDSRFIPAIEAFNFILHKYPTSNNINAAKIWREKTNIRLKNEEVALQNLKELFEKTTLEDKDFAGASAMMAQAYINMGSVDSALVHIKNAASFTKNKEQKGRLLFIKGQLYNQLQHKDSANLAFDEVIELNRKSPRTYMIHAHLEKIKNFDLEKGDKIMAEEHLQDLAENRENRPYLDVIHHQRGRFYKQIDRIDAAILAFNKSIKNFKQNPKLQAYNYEALGDIYFDKAEYKMAGDYYDSTLQRLVEKSKFHRKIKKKRDNLEDVINYEEIAKVNDSILRLVNMNPSERLSFFTAYTQELKEKATADSLALVKTQEKIKNQEFFNPANQGIKTQNNDNAFYFYNTRAAAQGKQDFIRRWGNRKLEDHWRRSNKSVNLDANNNQNTIANATKTNTTGDAFLPETYLEQIPTNQKEIDSLISDRDFAYYQLGLIYKEKFKEYNLAVNRLETLINFKPEERLLVPAKYHLYQTLELLGNTIKAQEYKNDIVANHPETRYAEIIRNPSAILSSDESSPEFKYYELYKMFENQQYAQVIEKANNYILQFTGDPLVPKFEMLKATAIGKQDGIEAYKKAINFVSLNYPNTEEGKKANNIYHAQLPKLENFDFEANNDSKRWKLIYEFSATSKPEALALKEQIDDFLKEQNNTFLSTSVDYYNASKMFVTVHGHTSREGAKGFALTLKSNSKFSISQPYFEISSPNYEVVQIHKNLESYNNNFN